MKTKLTKHKSILLGVLFLMLFTVKGYCQGNAYTGCIKNVTQTAPNQFQFDLVLEWTGTNTAKLQSAAWGIDFGYSALANGGTITGAFKPGSAEITLPPSQQNPSWSINQTSKSIRLNAAIETLQASAKLLNGAGQVRM